MPSPFSDQATASAPRVVLVVDDEAVIRDLCARALPGFEVLKAEHGAAALRLLERQAVDVVLTDVMMPEMNGLELLTRIKERTPNQVVIVMTGFADKEVILSALKANADDFISKPINLLQLRTTIDRALDKQALRDELSQLKRLDSLKSDFLGLISHKLKTPATAISLFLQNLAAGIFDTSDEGFNKGLGLVLGEARYLDDLIRDLLYFSEFLLDENPPHPEPLPPGETVQNLLGELEPQARGRALQLDVEVSGDLPELRVDRKRFTFIVRALLENAIKFTPPGGRITLRVGAGDGEFRLAVADTGIGIPREELPKVFEKFYQVDPAYSGQIRGFGLGLFYARQFAQGLGGTLHLDSTEGAGTVATVVFPAR